MRSFALLVLVAISTFAFGRALPKDVSIESGSSIPDTGIGKAFTTVTATGPAAVAAAKVTHSPSTTEAAKNAHKGKHEAVTASQPTTTSPAKSKGAKEHHAGKDHHKHHTGNNSTLTGSNSTNTALNSTLTSSNSTLVASNVTLGEGITSATNATNTTTITYKHAAGKKHKGKVAGTAKDKPASQPSTNSLDNIVGELTGLDLDNIARDLPSRQANNDATLAA